MTKIKIITRDVTPPVNKSKGSNRNVANAKIYRMHVAIMMNLVSMDNLLLCIWHDDLFKSLFEGCMFFDLCIAVTTGNKKTIKEITK